MNKTDSGSQGGDMIVEYFELRLKFVKLFQRNEELEAALLEIGNIYLSLPKEPQFEDQRIALGRMMSAAKRAMLNMPDEQEDTP